MVVAQLWRALAVPVGRDYLTKLVALIVTLFLNEYHIGIEYHYDGLSLMSVCTCVCLYVLFADGHVVR